MTSAAPLPIAGRNPKRAGSRDVIFAVLVLIVALMAACSDSSDDPALYAQFTARFEQPSTGSTSCPVTGVHFTDESLGEPTAWEWTFGDGTTSNEQNPIWEPGSTTARVTLTVSRGNAKDTVTKQITTHEC